MRSDSAKCYLTDIRATDTLKDIFKGLEIGCEIVEGGFENLIHDAAEWAFVPDFIVVDISEMTEVDSFLERFLDVSPAGETEMVLIGSTEEIDFYRHLRQMGVLDYFTKPLKREDVETTFRQAIERTRERRGEIARSKLVAVTHATPGAGASTIAHALSYYLARKNREVFLIDLDIVRGVQYLLAGANETPQYIEILNSPDRLDKLFLERTRIAPIPHLSLLSTCLSPDQKAPSEDKGVDKILTSIRESIDYVVFDAPANALVGRNVLEHSGRIVIVADPTLVSLRGISQIFAENNISSNQEVVVVLNKTGIIKDGSLPAKEFQERFEVPVVEIPFDPRGPYVAMMQGADLSKKENAVFKEMTRLVEALSFDASLRETVITKGFDTFIKKMTGKG